MGAWLTTQTAAGKTAAEAHSRALADAQAEYGHQEGYSGAINSKHGFIEIALPPRMTFAKLEALLSEAEDAMQDVESAKYAIEGNRPGGFYHGSRGWKGRLNKAEAALRKAQAKQARVEKKAGALAPRLSGLVEAYQDKWGPALAVELKGAEAKRYASLKRRGEKIYKFFGYAPC